jgi:ParB/RepB/Spo0J family partition protein
MEMHDAELGAMDGSPSPAGTLAASKPTEDLEAVAAAGEKGATTMDALSSASVTNDPSAISGNAGVDAPSTGVPDPSQATRSGADTPSVMSPEVRVLPINMIEIGDINARQISDDDPDLQELALSIQQRGLLQPILVAAVGAGYVLVAGERRLRACRLAGMTTIVAVVKSFEEGLADSTVDMVTENVQRKNFEPWEEATAYERLIAAGYSLRKIGTLIGKSGGYVSVLLKLTRNSAIRAALESRAISTWSLATELNRLFGPGGEERWEGAVESAIAFIRRRHPTVPELRGWIVEEMKSHAAEVSVDASGPRRLGASFLHKEEVRFHKVRTQEFPRLSRMELTLYRQLLAEELQQLDQLLETAMESESPTA